MGLADLLKSRAGRSKQQGGLKRPRQEEVQQSVHDSNGQAVWRPTLTRTALRKHHKARKLAARQAAAVAAAQQNGGAPADTSDEDDSNQQALANPVAALVGDDMVQAGGESRQSRESYDALLGALRGASSVFADLYQQRQREEAGHSDEEESEVSEAEGEEGDLEDEEEHEGVLSEDLEGQDEGDLGDEDLEERKVAGADRGLQEEGANGDGEDTGEEAGGGSDSDAEEATAGSDEDESGEEAVGAGRKGASKGKETQGGKGGGEAAPVVPAGTVAEEHFSEQFDRMLTDGEVAVLSARESAGAPKFEDCSTSAPWLASWKDASVEATPGARLPQQAPAELSSYGVKERLITRWREEGAGALQAQHREEGEEGDFSCSRQRSLFALLNSYCDLLYPCRPYPTAADAPDPELDAVLLHVLNHCAKAADRVRRNNERLKAAAAAAAAAASASGWEGRGEAEEPPRDQGFVRPKLLLLLPYRSSAYRVVLRLLRLAVKETRKDTIQNKERFVEEFGPGEEELSEKERRAIARKPSDYRALFDGNMDDHFRVGIKITRGAVRLYTDFFQSDIIVTSPLALATKLGEGPGEGGEHPQDFLSSIELVVLERADVMLMQNWNHVVTVFEALNRMPHQQHGVDIMRVREWALSGWSRMYRQTVLLSSFAAPEMNALLGRRCANHAGCARLRPTYPGVLSQVLPQVRQVFERLPYAGGLAAEADARFEHFKKVAWPRIREAGRGGGQLIYVPSYFDFVRVRNFLKTEAASFLVLSEYTARADAARARTYFFDGRKQVLLYTERAQFYNRNRIRGIKDVMFYQLPEHAHFYPEILNLLEDGGSGGVGGATGEHATVSVLFGRADALRLERVVGTARSGKMLKGSTTAFLFC